MAEKRKEILDHWYGIHSVVPALRLLLHVLHFLVGEGMWESERQRDAFLNSTFEMI